MGDEEKLGRNGLVLAAIGLGAAILLAGTWLLTSDLILDQERRHLLSQLEALLPDNYDNDPLEDVVGVQDPALGSVDTVPVYRVRQGGDVVAVMLTVIAPEGYSGPIRLLLGINRDGQLIGVRALSHKETPGLGDFIERKRSDWISQFDGRSLGDPPEEQWAVARDGGAFDQVTGATVTARAVTEAVAAGLRVFTEQRENILNAPPEEQP